MDYKDITIDGVNEVLGFDVTGNDKNMKSIRARQGAWLCFYINGYNYREIGRLFGYSEATVRKGVDMFEDMLKAGDKTTVELWQKLKVYEL